MIHCLGPLGLRQFHFWPQPHHAPSVWCTSAAPRVICLVHLGRTTRAYALCRGALACSSVAPRVPSLFAEGRLLAVRQHQRASTLFAEGPAVRLATWCTCHGPQQHHAPILFAEGRLLAVRQHHACQASLQKGLRSGWQSGAPEPHLLTRRCFPMVRVLPFRASACRSAHRLHSPARRLHRSPHWLHLPVHQFHHCAHQLLRPARRVAPFCAAATSSTQTMDTFMHHVRAPLHAPRRRALCATCHSAVLPARGYPSLFGSQCRLVANCQQRADAVRHIICVVEVCAEEFPTSLRVFIT